MTKYMSVQDGYHDKSSCWALAGSSACQGKPTVITTTSILPPQNPLHPYSVHIAAKKTTTYHSEDPVLCQSKLPQTHNGIMGASPSALPKKVGGSSLAAM